MTTSLGVLRLVDDGSPVVYYDNAEGWTLRRATELPELLE